MCLNEFKSDRYDEPLSPLNPVRTGDAYLDAWDFTSRIPLPLHLANTLTWCAVCVLFVQPIPR